MIFLLNCSHNSLYILAMLMNSAGMELEYRAGGWAGEDDLADEEM